jgi:lysophospholipase L1-like esterase
MPRRRHRRSTPIRATRPGGAAGARQSPSLPSLILIGDSTVRNGRDDGQGKGAAGQWGWGNPLAAFFDPAKVNVVNRAVGGLSSRTYLRAGHWERTLAFVKPAIVVLMQFGHNDSGPVNDTSRARGTIRGVGDETEEIDNLITTSTRSCTATAGTCAVTWPTSARGATPSSARRSRAKAGTRTARSSASADSYAGWAAQVARAEQIGFIDLNESVASRYDALGRDAVMQLFPLVTPDEHTHTNWAGAELNAQRSGGRAEGAGRRRASSSYSAAGAAIPKAQDDRPVVDAARCATKPRDPALPSLVPGRRFDRQKRRREWRDRLGRTHRAILRYRKINVVNPPSAAAAAAPSSPKAAGTRCWPS